MEIAAWCIYGQKWTNGKEHWQCLERVVGTFEQAEQRRAQLRAQHYPGMLRILKEEPRYETADVR